MWSVLGFMDIQELEEEYGNIGGVDMKKKKGVGVSKEFEEFIKTLGSPQNKINLLEGSSLSHADLLEMIFNNQGRIKELYKLTVRLSGILTSVVMGVPLDEVTKKAKKELGIE